MSLRKSILFFTALFFSIIISAQKKSTPKNDSPQVYNIKKGDQQNFPITLHPNQTTRIWVEQKGIDVGVKLLNEKDSVLVYRDSPNGKFGPEEIIITPTRTESATIVVKPLDEPANSNEGKFSILTAPYRPEVIDWSKPEILSVKHMKEDIDLFRKIREKADSGLYRYKTKQQTDSLYASALAKISKPMTATEFYRIILELNDFEGSCHNSVNMPHSIIDYLPAEKGFFPYYLKNIEGKLVVNESGGEIPLGSRIISIDGMSDADIMKRFYKYLPTDGYNVSAKQKFSGDACFGWRYPLEFGIRDSFRIAYSLPGSSEVKTVVQKSLSLADKREHFTRLHSTPFDKKLSVDDNPKYSFEQIDAKTARLNFRVFDMAGNADDPAFATFSRYLDSIFVKMKADKTENLIIDIRNNPGGNDPNYEKVFTYLTDASFRENTGAYIIFDKVPYPEHYVWNSADKENQQLEKQDLEAYFAETFTQKKNGFFYQDQKFNPTYTPNPNRFTGKVYLLIDENVASAGSHFASLVRAYSKATIVGKECTGGYYGHNGHFPMTYLLPNSRVSTRFSIVYVTQDAVTLPSQPVGRGIIPDIEVAQSFADFLKNEDTQMKHVLQLIQTKQ